MTKVKRNPAWNDPTAKKPVFTLNNGIILTKAEARKRLMNYMSRRIPLGIRQEVAEEILSDHWYDGTTIAYACGKAADRAWELWFTRSDKGE